LWQSYLDQLSKLIAQVKGDGAASQDIISRIQSLGQEDFEQQSIEQLESLDFIAQAIEQGDILVDFDARTGHNHGTKFRFRNNRLPDLYDEVTEIE